MKTKYDVLEFLGDKRNELTVRLDLIKEYTGFLLDDIECSNDNTDLKGFLEKIIAYLNEITPTSQEIEFKNFYNKDFLKIKKFIEE